MKKVFLIASLSVFVLASCKKDYTCECTVTSGSQSSTASDVYKDMKKKDAEEACEKNNVTSSNSSIQCEIK